jgi:hypothetical protein
VNNCSHSAGTKYVIDGLFIPDVGVPKDERPPTDGLYPFEMPLSFSVDMMQLVYPD